MARKWYAIEHRYGATVMDNGTHIGALREFASRADRDAWVSNGRGLDGPGCREALNTGRLMDRRFIRRAVE